MSKQRHFWCLVATVSSIANSAIAADLPFVPAPPPVVLVPIDATAYDWTGCYLGVDSGVGVGHSRHVAATPANPANAGLPLTNEFDLLGGLVGGTVGCNYQAGKVVFGAENDFSWADLKGSGNEIAPFDPAAIASTNENWLDTLRSRIGFARDRFLIYGTAGAAFANTGIDVCGPPCTSVSQNRTRWVAGAGGEWAAWTGDDWSLTVNSSTCMWTLGMDSSSVRLAARLIAETSHSPTTSSELD